jgi:hypothetical protein
VAFRDTLFFSLKNDKTGGGGTTRFEVVLDPDRRLDEETRDNNRASLVVSLPGFAALPLLPPDADTVGAAEITLVAQATRVVREKSGLVAQRFLLEIDTTATFDSPFRQGQTLTATWLPTYNLPSPLADATRYFWRIRGADEPESPQNGWAGRSFFYRKNHPGAWEALPEGAVDPAAGSAETGIEVPEGAVFRQFVLFRNLTNRPFPDSLLVRQTGTNRTTQRRWTRTWRVGPLAAGDSVLLEGAVPTLGFAGENDLRLTINPNDQPEVFFGNNSSDLTLTVVPDRANPVLQVTFDGRRIEDGELVSPRPVVEIRLTDENPFLPLPDTASLQLRWQKPGAGWARIAFRDPAVSWKKGAGNEIVAQFRPLRLPDGGYGFEAQGRDASGNGAGALPYRIHFRVKGDSLPTLRVFPNPFTEFTRFSLTLGEETIPATATLRIFTATGLPVRTLGPLRLRGGVNEWLWDGTDDRGAPLPSGVYAYRLDAGGVVKTGKVVLVRP